VLVYGVLDLYTKHLLNSDIIGRESCSVLLQIEQGQVTVIRNCTFVRDISDVVQHPENREWHRLVTHQRRDKHQCAPPSGNSIKEYQGSCTIS
jgi:hypothetical protein